MFGLELVGVGDVDRLIAHLGAPHGQLLGVAAVLATDHDHGVDLLRQDHGIGLAGEGHRADGVHHAQVMGAPQAERGELLELEREDGRLAEDAKLLGVRHALPGRSVHVVDDHVALAGVGANPLHLGMVLVADDADRVARL